MDFGIWAPLFSLLGEPILLCGGGWFVKIRVNSWFSLRMGG